MAASIHFLQYLAGPSTYIELGTSRGEPLDLDLKWSLRSTSWPPQLSRASTDSIIADPEDLVRSSQLSSGFPHRRLDGPPRHQLGDQLGSPLDHHTHPAAPSTLQAQTGYPARGRPPNHRIRPMAPTPFKLKLGTQLEKATGLEPLRLRDEAGSCIDAKDLDGGIGSCRYSHTFNYD